MAASEGYAVTPSAPTVRLGVMITPWAEHSHARWLRWRARFAADPRLDVAFVVGDRHLHGRNVTPRFDAVRVDAYEGLDHVGKVTEKSAAWWRAPGNEAWRCKADDDTLVHLPRLMVALERVDATRPALFGFVKWRGWSIGRFRACGGVWGTAADAWRALEDGRCPEASGPFPYTAGAFYCLSAPARELLRADREFADFSTRARARNVDVRRRPCSRAIECAEAPVEGRMWHHEDAGIGMNLFRSIVRANATLDVVATPGHFNDPFAIEMGHDDANLFWSARALWVHGIKRGALYEEVERRWNVSRHVDLPTLGCLRPADDRRSEWRISRMRCADRADAWCPIDPARHFRVCRWPWARHRRRAGRV